MYDHSSKAHTPGGWIMTTMLEALRTHPCRTNRPVGVPAEALGMPAFGTDGTEE